MCEGQGRANEDADDRSTVIETTPEQTVVGQQEGPRGDEEPSERRDGGGEVAEKEAVEQERPSGLGEQTGQDEQGQDLGQFADCHHEWKSSFQKGKNTQELSLWFKGVLGLERTVAAGVCSRLAMVCPQTSDLADLFNGCDLPHWS